MASIGDAVVLSSQQKQPSRGEKSDAEVDAALASIASDITRSDDEVSFSEQESKILDLWDQLKEIELERAHVQAQSNHANDELPVVTEESAPKELLKARREHLEARARYALRDSVVESVIQSDPVLKAVHSGENANQVEKELHPLIDKRDILSMVQTNLSSALQTTQNNITMVQAENLKAMRRNRELAAELWELANHAKTNDDLDAIDDIDLRAELETVQAEARDSKRQYRILKGLASGVVAGSGVDWARDETLRDIVLDDED